MKQLVLGILIFTSLQQAVAAALPDETCDVAVVGGGAAGIAAAAQSARAGAKTILIEQGFQVGGNMTSGGVNFPGLFHAWGKQVISGVAWEIVTNTVALGNETLPDFSQPTGRQHWKHQIIIQIPLFVALAEETLQHAGVSIHYHAAPTAITKQKTGWTLDVAAVGDTRKIHCKQLIDCSGNGAVAGLLNLPRLREKEQQPGTFVYSLKPGNLSKLDHSLIQKNYKQALADGRLQRNDTRWGIIPFIRVGGGTANYVEGADNSTADLRTMTNLRGRASMLRMYRFLREQPGLEKIKLVSMSPEVGVRETYRVLGEYLITQQDYVSGRKFPDAVCYAFYPIDLHNKKSGVHPAHLKEGVVATVPLRALIPRGCENLLVAGRCISSDRGANSALRVQATCMATGQAAGEAAALAAKLNCTPAKVPYQQLCEGLRKRGCIVP